VTRTHDATSEGTTERTSPRGRRERILTSQESYPARSRRSRIELPPHGQKRSEMYMHYRKQSEAALRFAERRRREDDAPRLSAEVPRLLTLRLEIEERSGGSVVAEPVHVRRIVVEHAPALFFLLVAIRDARMADTTSRTPSSEASTRTRRGSTVKTCAPAHKDPGNVRASSTTLPWRPTRSYWPALLELRKTVPEDTRPPA